MNDLPKNITEPIANWFDKYLYVWSLLWYTIIMGVTFVILIRLIIMRNFAVFEITIWNDEPGGKNEKKVFIFTHSFYYDFIF